MKKITSFCLGFYLTGCLLTFDTALAVPHFINFQGKLFDSSGPVSGSFPVTFGIYETEEGSVPLWEEVHTVVISNGMYGVLLGSGVPNTSYGNFDPLLFSGDNRWLAIKINGETLAPRQRITSIASVQRTGAADTVGGANRENFAETGHTHNFIILSGAATDVQIPDDITINRAVNSAALEGYPSSYFAPAVHTQSGMDIGSGTLSQLYVSDTLTRNAEMATGLDTKAALSHSHDGSFYTRTELDSSVDDLDLRLAALEKKLARLSVSGDGRDLTFSGVNIHIVNGTGTTGGTVNGRGNLIVGYNETRGTGDDRTGSHNIVTGTRNNFSSYSGLVAGYQSTVSGPYASVSGGQYNVASASYSRVSGGYSNEATGSYASVSGGYENSASDYYAGVSGGSYNQASDRYSSISGGGYNTASSYYSAISGGRDNRSSNSYASISGGRNNQASGYAASVSGGGGVNTQDGNIAVADYSSILGGLNNLAGDGFLVYDSTVVRSVYIGGTDHSVGLQSSVSGGKLNKASLNYASVSGGYSNRASGHSSSISGGADNTASGLLTSVSGGRNNLASGYSASVAGGGGPDYRDGNIGFADYSSILGGLNNLTGDGSWAYDSSLGRYINVEGTFHSWGQQSTSSGGTLNRVSGYYSSISGGEQSFTDTWHASVSGGKGNHATYAFYSSVSGGTNNEAGNEYASVSGGATNKAGATYSSVSSGVSNRARAGYSSVSGGSSNSTMGDYASVSGGLGNYSRYTAEGLYSSVSGGHANEASGESSSIGGGYFNFAKAGFSVVSGGKNNTASGPHSTVSGGADRSVTWAYDWRAGTLFQGQ